jgi:hypothetical protein
MVLAQKSQNKLGTVLNSQKDVNKQNEFKQMASISRRYCRLENYRKT